MGRATKSEPKPAARRPRGKLSRQDKVKERRRSLLDAAVRVIERKGLIGATMNDIASEAGCAYGGVAFHFKSKEGMLLAALDHVIEDYDRVAAEVKLDRPEDRLKAGLDLDFDPVVSSDGRIAVMTAFWAESVRNPEYRKRCAEIKRRYQTQLMIDIAALAERYQTKLDPALVARSLYALVDGLWIHGQVLGDADAAGRQQSRRACLFYLRSIFPDCF